MTEPTPPAPEDLRRCGLKSLHTNGHRFQVGRGRSGGLSALGSRVCRIEIPKGTFQSIGGLIGPDLLLTNYYKA